MNELNIKVTEAACLDTPLFIGIEGENNVTQVNIDYSAWVDEFGDGSLSLEIMRAGDTVPYIAPLTQEDGKAIWMVSNVDTGARGEGAAGFVFTVNEQVKKTAVIRIFVGRDVGGTPGERPDPYESLITYIEELLAQTEENAAAAASSATGAAGSATTAAQQAQAAAAARAAAEAARQAAEAAKGAAETAKQAAETARDAAASSATGAAGSATTAAQQAQAAAAARAAAEAAQQAVEAAKGAAETAKQAAETAQQAAETARDAAASSATGAAGSATTAAQQAQAAAAARAAAEAAQQAAEAAKGAAETAKQAAETARDAAASSATGAAGSATTAAQQAQAAAAARAAAEAAQQAAEAAKGAAETAQQAAEASRQAIENMTVSAETIDASSPTVEKQEDEQTGAVNLNFGFPKNQATTAATVGPAPIVTFDASAADMPLKSLTVDIEPVQDLHGYDHPWPAGGGKNLWSLGNISSSQTGAAFSVPAGAYTLSGTGTINADITFHYSDSTSLLVESAIGKTFELISDVTSIDIQRSAAGTISNIQLEAGSTATAYEPYSNICPISGWTGATVTRTGVNVWDEQWELGTYNQTTGAKTFNDSTVRSKNYIPVFPNTAYYAVFPGLARIFTYDASQSFLGSFTNQNDTFTTGANVHYITFNLGGVKTYENNISFNYPSTDHDYHAYVGRVYPIAFPSEAGTVYGGTLTTNSDGSGELAVEKASVDMSTLSWSFVSAQNFFVVTPLNIQQPVSSYDEIISSCYKSFAGKTDSEMATAETGIYVSSNGKLKLKDTRYSSVSELKTGVSGQTLVYPIDIPDKISLTGIPEITILLGTNNIWADCGDISVTYGAYLETLKASLDRTNVELDTLRACIAPIEDGATASQAYAAGAYFFRNGSFCTALTAISAGAAFTLGTNYAVTTVAAALIALQS